MDPLDPPGLGLDHLVVVAPTLARGVDWCEDVLGISPGAGGAHPLMGTHNRLVNMASPAFPRAYLEILAIDPEATALRAAGLRRWFDLDDPQLLDRVHRQGPMLVHWVARTPDVQRATAIWQTMGLDRGPVLQASRMTASGQLSWKITVRDDGQRLFDGVLPTLIEWGAVHPTDNMATPELELQSLTLRHPQAQTLRQALNALRFPVSPSVQVQDGDAAMEAVLKTPRGLRVLVWTQLDFRTKGH